MRIMPSSSPVIFSACPSIQYRVRKEILGQSPFLPEMLALQDQVLQEESIKQIINGQGSDGWLAWMFHGYESMESRMRLLCEKGMESDQPVLARALEALEHCPDRLERGLGKVGKILDELGFGGSETVRAHLFAHAGREDIPFVREQIQRAMNVLRSVIEVKSLECVVEPFGGKLVFRSGAVWPGIYHLRLLAMTQSWRTPENCKMIMASIQQMVNLSPIPNIYVKHKSQLIAPASFCMGDFAPDMTALTDAGWMQWFHRMELLSRLGVVDQIPVLRGQVQILEQIIRTSNGSFSKKLRHPSFQKWGSYTGLALEKDWRLAQRRINDLTFRSCLILHYVNEQCPACQ